MKEKYDHAVIKAIREQAVIAIPFYLILCGTLFYFNDFVAENGNVVSFGISAYIILTLVMTILMIPPIKMSLPHKPRPDDVKINQALRRAHGMDDTVEDE
jgi:membrane protein YdbS with pleckstrin-like domain